MVKIVSEEIKNVLQKIIDNGFSAYVVGGYVRDYLIGKSTNDIDICTNALQKELMEIFKEDNLKISNYGSIKLKTKSYSIDITTYRKELKYENGKLTEIEYINDLDTDIKRRDFTMNSLYMDINGNIIDKVNGISDIHNKIIKVVGNIDDKFSEDPLRILRALRFKITLNFELDSEIVNYIHYNKEKISQISSTRKKEEISRMLMSPNVISGFEYLKNLQILDILDISYDNLIYVDDICGMYAQLILPEYFPLTKEEKEHIESIRIILNYGIIDYGILFKYGLYLSIVAGKILGIDSKDINELYATMPIKSSQDLAIDGDEIQQLLNIEPSKVIKEIMESLVILIINKKIVNDNKILAEYILQNKGKWLK